MLPVKSHRKILLPLLCLLGLTTLAGCVSKPNRFGIIIISNEVTGPADIYRIPDNTQNKIERLTFTPTTGEPYVYVTKWRYIKNLSLEEAAKGLGIVPVEKWIGQPVTLWRVTGNLDAIFEYTGTGLRSIPQWASAEALSVAPPYPMVAP